MMPCQDWEEEDNFLEIAAGRRRRGDLFPLKERVEEGEMGPITDRPKTTDRYFVQRKGKLTKF